MEEETRKHEGEAIKIEDSNKEDHVCHCCGKQVDTVYFYCEECHRIQKRENKEALENKVDSTEPRENKQQNNL